jgi:hypothetical protein
MQESLFGGTPRALREIVCVASSLRSFLRDVGH